MIRSIVTEYSRIVKNFSKIRTVTQNSTSFLIPKILNGEIKDFGETEIKNIYISKESSNEIKTLFLAYSIILDGHKKEYFDTDGNIIPEKLAERIEKYLPPSHFEARIPEEFFNLDALRKIKKHPDGSITFGDEFQITKQELSSQKIFRGPRYSSIVEGPLAFHNHPLGEGFLSQGQCAGISAFHAGICLDAFLEPERKKEIKKSYFENLNAEYNAFKRTNSLQDKPTLNKIIELQSIRGQKVDKNAFYDKKLGCASHAFIFFSIESYGQFISTYINEMIEKEILSSIILVGTHNHEMDMLIERNQENSILKITIYESNETDPPIVTYLDSTSDEDSKRGKIQQALTKIGYFSQSEHLNNASFHIICYPFGKNVETIKKGSINVPLIFSQYNETKIGTILSASIALGFTEFTDLASEILDFDIAHDKKIDLSNSTETYSLKFKSILGITLLHCNYPDIAIKIIQNYPLDRLDLFSEKEDTGESLLSAVLRRPDLLKKEEILNALIQKDGFNINCRLEKGTTTFLHLVVMAKAISTIRFLLQSGYCSFDQLDSSGKNAFEIMDAETKKALSEKTSLSS
jgi:hypothetical protein